MTQGYDKQGVPDVGWWIGALRKGVEYRKKMAYQSKWDTWEKYYRGEFDIGVMPTNMFFKMVRTMVPRVYFRDPTVSITQSVPGDEYAVFSQILERVDNKLITFMKLKAQMKLSIQDAFMCGTGILKMGFGAQYTPTPDNFSTEAPDSKKKRGEKLEYNSLIDPNMPWVMRVHPMHFVVPDRATSIDAARWVAHEIMMNIEDVKNDPRFRNTHSIELNKPLMGKGTLEGPKDIGPDNIVLYEVRDKKTGKVFILAPTHSQKVLWFGDDKYLQDTGRFPFFPIVFNQAAKSFWGIPDAQILDPQQREANETRTQMMKHRRMSLVKLLVKRDAITPDEIEKMSGQGVAAVVEVDELGSVEPLTVVNQIPTGLVESLNEVNQEAQEIMGLGSNQFGEYAPGSADRSATEASIVNQATQIRIDERRDLVADTIVDLMTGVHTIIFQFWSQEQIIDVVGDDGAVAWIKFTPEMLKRGVYEINVDPDSGLPQTAQLRQQQALQLYPILLQNPYIDKLRLTQFLLRELHGAQYDHLIMTPQELQTQQQAAAQAAQSAVTPQQFAQGNPKTIAARRSGGHGRGMLH